jgi:hypothetical protein
MFARFAGIGVGHEIQYRLPQLSEEHLARSDGGQVLDDDEPEAVASGTFDIDGTADQDEGSDDEDRSDDDDDDIDDVVDNEDYVSEDQEDSEDEGQDFKF